MFSISISGTHSVGKTTIADKIVRYYSGKYNVVEIKEVARHLIAAGFKMSKDITEYGVIHYLNEYLKLERKLVGDVLISDRSLIDLLAYVSVNNVYYSRKIRSAFLSLIEEIVYLECQKYVLYIYIPIEFPMIEDGVRPSDILYREQVDAKIKELLDKYNLKKIIVTGTIEQRKHHLIKIINEKLNIIK